MLQGHPHPNVQKLLGVGEQGLALELYPYSLLSFLKKVCRGCRHVHLVLMFVVHAPTALCIIESVYPASSTSLPLHLHSQPAPCVPTSSPSSSSSPPPPAPSPRILRGFPWTKCSRC